MGNFNKDQIVRVFQDGQYVKAVNTSGNEIILPISIFADAGDLATAIARLNALVGTHTIAFAAGVIRPTIPAQLNDPLVWNFLDEPGDQSHTKIYFNGTVTASANVLTLVFPDATKVVSGVVNIDDSLVHKKVAFGTAMDTNAMIIECFYLYSFGPVITNNGTTWGTLNLGSGGTDATVAYDSLTGVITINDIPQICPSYNNNIVFGTKDPSLTIDAHVRMVFQNLAVGQQKCQLVTSAGVPIFGPPDINWTLHMTGDDTPQPLIVDTLNTNNEHILETLSNLWVEAILQLD